MSTQASIDIPGIDKSRASLTSSKFTVSSGQDEEPSESKGEFDADENKASIAAGRAGKSRGDSAVMKRERHRVRP